MNIESITLLNQFVEYSCNPLTVLMIVFITGILAFISILLLNTYHATGILVLIFSLIFGGVFGSMASNDHKNTFLNYPAYTHYIIQINDKTAWAEIVPNYTIIKEVYPNTDIYEIKQEYKEEDEQ